ncbi:MAG: MlaD family protein [Verrucomicrobiota bacterium]
MKEKHLEQKVGAFVLAGLIVIAILILAFGRFGQLFERTYDIVAEFPNASGIIKNSQVLYRGAKVGIVPDVPKIANQGESVEITLRINGDVLIPRNAEFRIGVYGLLGDRFVDIIPPSQEKKLTKEEALKSSFLSNGDRVKGSENPSVGDLLATAQQKLENFDSIVRDLQSKILTESFISDFHEGIRNAKNMLERGDRLLQEAESGYGPIFTLLNDKEMATNLKQLIYNLRTSGILFYHDYTEEKESENKKKEPSPSFRSRR